MKKYIFFSSILIMISFLFFNFLSPKENSEKNWRYNTSKRVQLLFQKFYFNYSRLSTFCWGIRPLYAPDIWERYDKEIHKNVYCNQIHFFILKEPINSSLLLGSILEKK